MDKTSMFEKLNAYGADTVGALERFIGDAELYGECLMMFIGDNSFDALGKSMKAEDYNAAFNAAHSLKGVSGNLGLEPFYKAVCTLVESLRAQPPRTDVLPEQYALVAAEYMKLKSLINTELCGK